MCGRNDKNIILYTAPFLIMKMCFFCELSLELFTTVQLHENGLKVKDVEAEHFHNSYHGRATNEHPQIPPGMSLFYVCTADAKETCLRSDWARHTAIKRPHCSTSRNLHKYNPNLSSSIAEVTVWA